MVAVPHSQMPPNIFAGQIKVFSLFGASLLKQLPHQLL
jgi:hypothetical protein